MIYLNIVNLIIDNARRRNYSFNRFPEETQPTKYRKQLDRGRPSNIRLDQTRKTVNRELSEVRASRKDR